MTKQEILDQARILINDPDKNFCSDAEMMIHLDQVALDFARQTQVLRTSADIDYDAESAVIDLPADCNEILRVIRSDGQELKFTSSRDLASSYPTWLLNNGLPRNYLNDLTGNDQFRLWPNPSEAGTVTVFYYQGHVPGGDLEIPARFHNTLVFGVAARAVANSISELDASKVQRFSDTYIAGIRDAISDSEANFNRRPRNFSTESF